jgi:shikimate dehydrogenase
VLNRTLDRAASLAAALGDRVRAESWDRFAAVAADAALLINTTTQGMVGQPALELDLARLAPGAIVTDLIYTPLETPLLADARRRGHPVVDGLGMLLWQAKPGFAAWFGVEPEVTDALRAAVLADR